LVGLFAKAGSHTGLEFFPVLGGSDFAAAVFEGLHDGLAGVIVEFALHGLHEGVNLMRLGGNEMPVLAGEMRVV
jgi:hypothetical protein